MKDYYGILGVGRDASESQIKDAFRSLAKKHHPDLNPGDKEAEKKFKDINEAYDVLKDSEKRSLFDRGMYDNQAGAGAGFSGFQGGGFGSFFEDIMGQMGADDIFGRRGTQRTQKGNDLLTKVLITLEEAFTGVQKDIKINALYACTTCEGSGSSKDSSTQKCPSCGGVGRIRKRSGFFSVEQICGTCQGQGSIIKDPCSSCGGAGRVQDVKEMQITIPKGIDNGTRLRLQGKGEAGMHGAPAGDLFVEAEVKDHKFFARKGENLYLRISIPLVIAISGDYITLPTIDGTNIDMKIPAGTQSNQTFRVSDYGMYKLQSRSRGSLYVEVKVDIPEKLSKDQITALKKLFPLTQDKSKVLPLKD